MCRYLFGCGSAALGNLRNLWIKKSKKLNNAQQILIIPWCFNPASFYGRQKAIDVPECVIFRAE